MWFNEGTLSYMEVNHGGGDVGMAEQLFQGNDPCSSRWVA